MIKKILLIVLSATFVSCGDSSSGDEGTDGLIDAWNNGTISGTITDSSSGNVIADVSVTNVTSETTTASGVDGIYSFKNLTSGDYSLAFTKSGYQAKTLTISVSNDQNADGNTTLTLNTGGISGTITDSSSGTVISGVSVTNTTTGASTTSNDSGAYNFLNLVPGNHSLSFSKSNYQTKSAIIAVMSDQISNGNTTLTLSPNQFVAVGASGTIIASVDGSTWTTKTSGTTTELFKVKHLNSKLYAVGRNGLLLKSDNGNSWESISTGTTANFMDIHYYNNLYVIVGGNESSGGNSIILTSTDTSSWTKITTTTQRELSGITYLNTRYVAVACCGTNVTSNSIGSSTDGSNWGFSGTNFSQNRSLNGLTTDSSSLYAAGGSGLIIKSNDFFNWTQLTTGITSMLQDITHGSGKLVAVGNGGTIIYSADGTNWTDETINGAENLYGVNHGHSLYIAVGNNGAIYKSSNSTNWESLASPTSSLLRSVEAID